MDDPDPGAETDQQQQPPENQDPPIIAIVVQLLQQYGWFILLGVLVAAFLWNKFAKKYRQWRQGKEDNDLKKYDQNTAQQRIEAMERARQKLQEQYDSKANEYAEKQKLKEEEKRKEKIEDWERHLQGKGYRNKYKVSAETPTPSTSQSQPKKKRPTDYNPLMGAGGGGASFRPAGRRSGGG